MAGKHMKQPVLLAVQLPAQPVGSHPRSHDHIDKSFCKKQTSRTSCGAPTGSREDFPQAGLRLLLIELYSGSEVWANVMCARGFRVNSFDILRGESGDLLRTSVRRRPSTRTLESRTSRRPLPAEMLAVQPQVVLRSKFRND